MELFDYLKSFESCCDIETLKKVTEERSSWPLRKNTQELWSQLSSLPSPLNQPKFNANGPEIKIGEREDLSTVQFNQLYDKLKDLIPWKKGPFDLFGIKVDGEWRSDFKWARIEKALGPLTN